MRLPPSLFAACALLGTIGAAPAQAWITAQSTWLAVHADGGGDATIANGTDVTPGFVLARSGAAGRATAAGAHTTGSEAIELRWNATALATDAGTFGADLRAHFELCAALPLPATVTIAWRATARGTGHAECAVDLGADGTIDATGAAVLACTLGPVPTPLDLRLAASARGAIVRTFGNTLRFTGDVDAELIVRVQPAHVAAVAFAPACGDTALAANGDFVGGVALHGRLADGAPFAFAVAGFDRAPWPLPLPPGCTLQLTPVATLLLLADAQRQVGWNVATWRVPQRPLTFAAQLLAVTPAPLAVHASAPLAITVR